MKSCIVLDILAFIFCKERETAGYKYRAAPGMAMTGNRANDTPVQPQSERDKRYFGREAVAGNGGGCMRTM